MNPAQLRVHIEAYLNLRRSLGFQTAPGACHLRELSDYVEAQGFSWPIRTQTILDWISAASLHCGLPGQRMRLIHARCFLRHLKASVPDTEVPGPSLLPHQPRPKPRLYSTEEITKLGLKVTPSVANFVLIHFPLEKGKTSAEADAFLTKRGLVLRALNNYGLPHALRMTIGTEEANRLVLDGLRDFVAQK